MAGHNPEGSEELVQGLVALLSQPTVMVTARQAMALRLIELLHEDPVDIRATAAQVVTLRSAFENQGRPDWAGRSQDYRDCIYRVYKDAGVPADSVGPLQANLRYHIGNTVREVAPAEDLAALGLDPAGPRERAVRARAEGKVPKRKPVLSRANDPLAMAGFALEAVRAVREMRPRGEMAEAVELELRRLIEETFTTLALLPKDTRRRASRPGSHSPGLRLP